MADAFIRQGCADFTPTANSKDVKLMQNEIDAIKPEVTSIPLEPSSPILPEDHRARYHFANFLGDFSMGVMPVVFTSWQDECTTWKESCYLGSLLNPMNPIRVWGPDALQTLKDFTTNSYEKFGVGRAKHAIFCGPDGNIVCDGILLRMAEDEFLGYCLPYWANCIGMGNYDVQFEFLPNEVVYQLGGPTSLQVVEAACEEDLHDIKFLQHRPSSICGHEVRILRAGMAGSLAYEVHCTRDHCAEIYRKLVEVGRPFGLKRLGMAAYNMTHRESGFPNAYLDWMPAFPPEVIERSKAADLDPANPNDALAMFIRDRLDLRGSVGKDLTAYFRNPYELGWGKAVRFDHDFVGREALEKIAAGDHRVMKTLVWNVDDVTAVFRDQLTMGGVPSVDIAMPDDTTFGVTSNLHQDWVLKDGEKVGVSAGRMVSVNYGCMLSLGVLEPSVAEEGSEVKVLWGAPGERQWEIRATVARYPYLDVTRNDKLDVNTIPSFGK